MTCLEGHPLSWAHTAPLFMAHSSHVCPHPQGDGSAIPASPKPPGMSRDHGCRGHKAAICELTQWVMSARFGEHHHHVSAGPKLNRPSPFTQGLLRLCSPWFHPLQPPPALLMATRITFPKRNMEKLLRCEVRFLHTHHRLNSKGIKDLLLKNYEDPEQNTGNSLHDTSVGKRALQASQQQQK